MSSRADADSPGTGLTLAPGQRLGPYEILGPLGTGGMGEVYRARDTRLGRDVAVKRLRPELASSEDRRKRFEREARAASALTHPHIVSLFDIGEEDGVLFMAMELVEGKTLREALGDERPTARRILDLAVQAAGGLARAHADGIVHRDLKPENLMISRDGYIKILDFGLAKLVEPERVGSGSDVATAISGTQAGTVLGTVGYMSPEQAAGRAVDFRSDQFSLGTILYEMAAGRKPFERDSSAETLTAIIREDPEPLVQAAPRLPAPLRWVIERCLAKDPEERYASTKDLARELEMLRRRLGEAGGSGETSAVGGDAASERFPTLQRLTFRRGTILSARFAPDGQTVIYGAAWEGQPCRLFSTRPESPESGALALPEAEILSISTTGQMAVSLDRHWAARFVWTGIVAQAALLGGAPREILEDVQWADWGPDGASLSVIRRVGGKCRVEYPLGTTLFDTAGWLSHVRVSPDGERVAFLHHPTQGDDGGEVISVDRAGARAVTHSEGWITAYGLVWRSAAEIWFTATRVGVARSIWAVPVSGGRERLLARTPGELTIQDVARDGRALMTSDNGMVGIMGARPGEKEERDLSLLDWSLLRDISRDGKAILFDETGEGGGQRHGVYVRRTDGSPAVRLGEGVGGSFSPDGRWAVSRTAGSRQLVLLPVRAGEARPLDVRGLNYHSASWIPDGKGILTAANEAGAGARLWVYPLDGEKPRPVTDEGVEIGFFPVSPDGRQVVAQTPDFSWHLFPMAGGEPQAVAGLEPDDRPVAWTPDGSALYGFRRGQLPGHVFKLDLAKGTRETHRELRPRDPSGVVEIVSVVQTPDGSGYAYSQHRILSDLFLVDGLR
jgi:eukaryotic-like serine/threonine-protein kinase